MAGERLYSNLEALAGERLYSKLKALFETVSARPAGNCCVLHLSAYLWHEDLPLQMSPAAVSRPFQTASPSQARELVHCCLQHEYTGSLLPPARVMSKV